MVATVRALKSSAAAVSYFEKDGYYAKDDPEHRDASFWHGEAAKDLGLKGHVLPGEFEDVLAGWVPGTEIRLGRMREGENDHRPGLDITFSAPKSVSLEALVIGDRRVIRAHDDAVRATLDWIERDLLQTRGFDPITRQRPRVEPGERLAVGAAHRHRGLADPGTGDAQPAARAQPDRHPVERAARCGAFAAMPVQGVPVGHSVGHCHPVVEKPKITLIATFPGAKPLSRIVICEKPSQAADIRRAVGARYGEILPCQGHLLRLAEPAEINPEWKSWSFDLLKPTRFYPWRADQAGGKGKRLAAIAQALKTAAEVTIATDCDREGQLIGQSLLEHLGFRGTVFRAVFTAQDPKTLGAAFEARRPNADFANLFAAAMARQQSDQVYNLTLTRAATRALRPPAERGAIGIGRVKTPTLAIAARRELEIREFRPKAYFEVTAAAETASGGFAMRHAPAEEHRIADRVSAEAVAARAEGFAGPLAIERARKRRRPPRLLDLPALQKRCGGWGWTADRTLETAQALYETHKLITYPRAEAAWLAETQIAEAGPILAALGTIEDYAPLVPATPEIRKGKSGHFCDSCLAGVSHHAVVPNINGLDRLAGKLAKLGKDEARLFDTIARSYIAALLPDHEFEATTATLDVGGALFVARGRVVLEAGWRAAWSGEDEDEDAELPPLADGERAALSGAGIEAKETRPPPRFHEGGLIDAMQNAWRYVDDEALAERLRDAKGIGTPATRASIIEGLKAQDMLQAKGKHIVPTEAGLALYRKLAEAAPALVDPGTTAAWELRLDEILTGKATAEEVWEEISEAAAAHVALLRAAAPPAAAGGQGLGGGRRAGSGAGAGRKPSPKQLAFAENIAKATGKALPEAVRTDAAACSAFIDANKDAALPPSPKQLAFAESIAKAIGKALPAAVRTDAAGCSAFIDANKGAAAPRKAGRRPPGKAGAKRRTSRRRGT